MDEDDKNNILATLKASLDSIFAEKLADETWKQKINETTLKVNIAVISAEKNDPDRAYLSIVVDNGTVVTAPERLEDEDFELAATFERLFKIATGDKNAVLSLLSGSVKVTGLLKNMKKVLFLQKMLLLD